MYIEIEHMFMYIFTYIYIYIYTHVYMFCTGLDSITIAIASDELAPEFSLSAYELFAFLIHIHTYINVCAYKYIHYIAEQSCFCTFVTASYKF